jgi:hypothetical protein
MMSTRRTASALDISTARGYGLSSPAQVRFDGNARPKKNIRYSSVHPTRHNQITAEGCPLGERRVAIYCAGPIVSAMVAPRMPSGFSPPTVVSRAVWCSISELISAPNRTTIADIHIHVIVPIAAPSDP